jgi:hypothetical protein
MALLDPWAEGGRAAAMESTVRAHAAASGTSSSAKRARYRIPALTPRRIGPNRAGMVGSMAGSCT